MTRFHVSLRMAGRRPEGVKRFDQQKSPGDASLPHVAAPPSVSAAPSILDKSAWEDALAPLLKIVGWLKDKPAAISLVLFMFLILKVIAVAKGDTFTALGILQTASLTTIVVGGLLSGLPLLSASLFAAVVYRLIRDWPRQGYAGYALTAACLLVCIFVTPWFLLAITSLAAILLAIYVRLFSNRGPGLWTGIRTVAGITLLFFTFAAAWDVLYNVWLPQEVVSVRSSKPVVGYVLDDRGNWVSILLAGQRKLVRFPAAQVSSRVLCGTARPARLWVLFEPNSPLTSVWQELAPHINERLTPRIQRPCPGRSR